MKRLINTISPIIGLLILGLFTTVLVSTFQKPKRFDSSGTGFASVSPATSTPYYIPSTEIPPITLTSELVPVPWPSPTPLPLIPSEKRIGFWTENLLFGSPQPFAKGLKDPFGQISWSPDGSQLAISLFTGEFIRDETGQPAWELTWIALIDPSGSSVTPLVRGFLPFWSPDGRYIAYLLYSDGLSPLHLQLFDLEDKQVIEVVPFVKGEIFPKIAWLSASELAFYKGEPTIFNLQDQQIRPLLGRDLASQLDAAVPMEYITSAPAAKVFALGSSQKIWLIKWEDGKAQLFRQVDEGLDHAYWALSPDGNFLAYVSALSRQVKIIRVDDPTISVEVPAQGRGSPLIEDWSPDSTALLYVDSAGLKIVNRDGSGLYPITGEISHARWSPDGMRILGTDFNGQLWEIAVTQKP
ncbi:MAG: hypothetical protein D6750_10085 [Bacteroidetes bacterium]|jgi:WD40 repeat protein|nr:MAG: hypothetical protein D6750_10085 [Bacteroidota bacterium]